jgi:hypothetical protein
MFPISITKDGYTICMAHSLKSNKTNGLPRMHFKINQVMKGYVHI